MVTLFLSPDDIILVLEGGSELFGGEEGPLSGGVHVPAEGSVAADEVDGVLDAIVDEGLGLLPDTMFITVMTMIMMAAATIRKNQLLFYPLPPSGDRGLD